MTCHVAFSAKPYYVQPEFWRITLMMMRIYLTAFSTALLTGFMPNQAPVSDCLRHGLVSLKKLYKIWITPSSSCVFPCPLASLFSIFRLIQRCPDQKFISMLLVIFFLELLFSVRVFEWHE